MGFFSPVSRFKESMQNGLSAMASKAKSTFVNGMKKFEQDILGNTLQSCPYARAPLAVVGWLTKNAGDISSRVDDFTKLKYLRIGKTVDGFRTLKGAINALDFAGSGKFNLTTLFKKVAGVTTKGIAVDVLFDVVGEAVDQAKKGEFKPSRLLATGEVGVVKSYVSTLAFAGGVALTAAAFSTAPAWIPVAIGVAAAYGVGKLFDAADERFGLTDKVAATFSQAGNYLKGII